jgi:hypothetical protein
MASELVIMELNVSVLLQITIVTQVERPSYNNSLRDVAKKSIKIEPTDSLRMFQVVILEIDLSLLVTVLILIWQFRLALIVLRIV